MGLRATSAGIALNPTLSGDGLAKAGFIPGIVGVVLGTLWVLAQVAGTILALALE